MRKARYEIAKRIWLILDDKKDTLFLRGELGAHIPQRPEPAEVEGILFSCSKVNI